MEIRRAQLSDSLEELRSQLRMRTFTNRYKIKNVTGQRVNTSTQALLNQIGDKVRASSVRYQRARAAHLDLAGPGGWEKEFRLLAEKDVRGLNERALTDREADERRFAEQVARSNDDEDPGNYAIIEGEDVAANQQGGEGFRGISWIWFSVGANVDLSDPTMHEGALTISFTGCLSTDLIPSTTR